jgi:hypothetical protein
MDILIGATFIAGAMIGWWLRDVVRKRWCIGWNWLAVGCNHMPRCNDGLYSAHYYVWRNGRFIWEYNVASERW